MSKIAWCAAVVLLGSAALRADTFTFSYTATLGGPVNASGTIYATDLGGFGSLELFQIDSVTGTRNLENMIPPESGGLLYIGPNVMGSISFTLSGSGMSDTVSFLNGGYSESGGNGLYNSAGNFSISRSMPEPATLGLFLSMGLGVFLLVRRLPSNKRV